MTHEEKEETVRRHDALLAPNLQTFGPCCFYCGGAHPSDSCRSPERDEWWRDEREAIR